MKRAMTALLLVCAGFGSARAQLKIDFGVTGSPVESGFQAYTATHEVANTFTPQTFQAFGSTITVALTWPSGAANTAMQMFDRTTDTRYAYTGEHGDLLRDWTGTDGRVASANPLALTLSGLPRGTYSWLSYHHDGIDQTGVFSVTVKDASGAATTADLPVTDSAGGDNIFDFASVAAFATEFTSNGTDDVVFEFTLTSSSATLGTAFFVMNSFEIELITELNLAHNPRPSDKQTDVLYDSVLSWTPGYYAAGHDVYLGTTFEDVNAATTDSPLLASAGQDANSYDPPGVLQYGQTYYWRVDEVNAPPSSEIFKGTVWSFTAEPFAYAVTNVIATASSSAKTTAASKTVDGSGLNADGQHSVDLTHTWLSNNELPCWIQYEFDKVCKLDELRVWNSNQSMEQSIGWGAKDVIIEYSTDRTTWTALENVPEFTQAPGEDTCAADTVVDFGGALAKYVKLTINTNWGGLAKASGLSEVLFYYVPVQAREPQPADGATDVSLDARMNWRPGREATSHEVLFGTDSNAVANGLVAAGTVADHSYTPAPMSFGTTYYWKVNELGDTGTYEGDLWSFTSLEFATVEGFEDYDDADNRIFNTWVDGYGDDTNGSIVGYIDSANGTFGETTTVHGGKQSMPMAYDNSGASHSEAVREFATAQNWTGSGATELCVWTRGYPALAPVAVTETGGKMALTGSGRDIWDNDDQFTYAFKTLTGDGTLVARVTSTGTGTNTWAKGGVMIRESLNGNSAHAMMVVTGGGGNGASFQYRQTTAGGSAGVDFATAVTVPYWVKIERIGDNFSGYTSTDGKTWTALGSMIIVMEGPVYIGLCVTSHVTTEERTFEFDGIASTGAVTGAWQGAAISSPLHNDSAQMYLTVEDSTGKKATATSDTAATVADWTRWVVPMSDLSGVSFTKVKRVTLGVKDGATPGSFGMVFIDDIGFGASAAQD